MYELLIDCGTYRDWHTFESLEDYKSFMSEVDQEKQGFSDELLSTGILNFGIDCYELSEVFPKYEISEGSLLGSKSGRGLSVVNSITVDENGVTEVNTQECWFYNGKLCYDYECYGESLVQDIYKFYDLVGEDFKLFKGVG